MVSDKSQTVACTECHTRDDGRLEGLRDFYMPGRDYSAAVETGGSVLLLLTFIGVLIHAGVRVGAARRRKNGGVR